MRIEFTVYVSDVKGREAFAEMVRQLLALDLGVQVHTDENREVGQIRVSAYIPRYRDKARKIIEAVQSAAYILDEGFWR